jgi:hypothetical protein
VETPDTIQFANLALIRKRINLRDEDTPVIVSFSELDIPSVAFQGLITTISHVEGTIYDVVISVSHLPDDYLAKLQEAEDAARAEAFEAIGGEE